MARKVKVMKASPPTSKPITAIKVTGRFNNGNRGAKVLRKIPNTIEIK
jgi:hypothetical protein